MFQASTSGGRCLRGTTSGLMPSGHTKVPSALGCTVDGAGGPCARLKTDANWLGPVMFCAASTGRFCVTVWPKSEPKTPMS